jgi:PLP dependent protein
MIRANLDAIHMKIRVAAEKANTSYERVKVVAVSKTRPAGDVQSAISAGQKVFGENKVQEAIEKIDCITEPVEWHMVGHLQSNKAGIAVKYFDLIHSVDSMKLVKEVNKQAKKNDKVQSVLIQVNVAEDDSKFGITAPKVSELVKAAMDSDHLKLLGLMTIPPLFDNPEKARVYFRRLREIAFEEMVVKGYIEQASLEISMGMSNDYEIAVEEGATIVRIGTAIFGRRVY